MKINCLVTLIAAATTLCSCKSILGNPEAITGTAGQEIKMLHGHVYEFPGEQIFVFRINPQGNPSGEVTLSIVQNGQIQKVRVERFLEMHGESAIAVKQKAESVDISLSGGVMTLFHQGSAAALPTNLRLLNSGRGGNWIITPDGQSHIFWELDFGKEETIWSGRFECNTLDDAMRLSKQQPDNKAYVVSVRLDQGSK